MLCITALCLHHSKLIKWIPVTSPVDIAGLFQLLKPYTGTLAIFAHNITKQNGRMTEI